MRCDITFEGGKKVNARFNGFSVNTDQPLEDGGENSAPSPFDYFLAALGTCAGFYVLSFCDARALPKEDIRISLQSEYNEEKGRLETVRLTIHVPEAFPAKYRKALVKSASRCSVKKAILDPPVFEITAASR
jgi:ribosomal protein S12 methylthiotransferase accessory factor